MKFVIVIFCLVTMSWCAPTLKDTALGLPAVLHEEVHDEYGQFAYRYITAQGMVVSERGRLVPSQNGGHVLVIEGQYQYVGDDGKVYVTRYRSGPDGFHAEGAHLPKSVPMPIISK